MPSVPIRDILKSFSEHTAVKLNGASADTVNNDFFKAAISRFSVRFFKRSSEAVQITVTGSRIQCSGKQAGLLCNSSL